MQLFKLTCEVTTPSRTVKTEMAPCDSPHQISTCAAELDLTRLEAINRCARCLTADLIKPYLVTEWMQVALPSSVMRKVPSQPSVEAGTTSEAHRNIRPLCIATHALPYNNVE